ncbi:HlyD family efflux transporter periplasmic adaptor subunit [Polymorphum gilvum]|uniref:Multidrug resistance efflux pump-like protein n=1 Tax=Polymorphum gilvum (strain LMG 25793 / CGMCC 1.9160 / SL003B-26A1) TaxID=991905 RepID=F2J392_POLGS|nr:HlyD family efflux transporter periplasmic adaptor subunit [Polymorphum gilvum]ADZ69899.1 Multidrug resistance efflux pump-like protein [Polymorphum gilvum SL003B-26A1]
MRRRSGLATTLRKIRYVPALMALMATGGLIGMYFQPPGLKFLMRTLDLQPGGGTTEPIAVPAAPNPPTPAAEAAARSAAVLGLGRLVPAGKVITLALPSAAGDAKIVRLDVAEGQRVAQGQILAVLDTEPRLRNAIDLAAATVAVREADLNHARETVRASLDQARAAVARQEAAALTARQELERTKTLRARNIVSEAVLERAQGAADQAERNVEEARAALSRYLSEAPDSQSDVVVALRNLASAEAQLRAAEQDLEEAYVRAPIAGTVLEIHARPGEKPGAAGVLDIADTDDMTVEVEIYQAQIARVAVGAPVEITGDALPAPLSGTVSRIGLMVKRQSIIDKDPAANTDARVFEVQVRLDRPSSAIASRFVDLQVRARIEAGPRS